MLGCQNLERGHLSQKLQYAFMYFVYKEALICSKIYLALFSLVCNLGILVLLIVFIICISILVTAILCLIYSLFCFDSNLKCVHFCCLCFNWTRCRIQVIKSVIIKSAYVLKKRMAFYK